MVKTGGDCYEVNGRYFMDNMWKDKDLRLVHGNAILLTDGKPFGHCWLEKGDKVLDFSNGFKVIINKEKYYKIGVTIKKKTISSLKPIQKQIYCMN